MLPPINEEQNNDMAVHGNSEVSSGKWNIRKTRIQSSDAVNDSLRTPLRKRKNISPETLQRVSKRRKPRQCLRSQSGYVKLKWDSLRSN